MFPLNHLTPKKKRKTKCAFKKPANAVFYFKRMLVILPPTYRASKTLLCCVIWFDVVYCKINITFSRQLIYEQNKLLKHKIQNSLFLPCCCRLVCWRGRPWTQRRSRWWRNVARLPKLEASQDQSNLNSLKKHNYINSE